MTELHKLQQAVGFRELAKFYGEAEKMTKHVHYRMLRERCEHEAYQLELGVIGVLPLEQS